MSWDSISHPNTMVITTSVEKLDVEEARYWTIPLQRNRGKAIPSCLLSESLIKSPKIRSHCKTLGIRYNGMRPTIEMIGWENVIYPDTIGVQVKNTVDPFEITFLNPMQPNRNGIHAIPSCLLFQVVLIRFFHTLDNPKSSRSPITDHGQWLPILLGHSQKSFFVYNYVNRIIYTFFYKKVKRLFNSIFVAINNKKFKIINNLSKTINKC